ncbi:HotDog domain-containing protein [Chaetomium fimeti]|uniref:HotDog domain-containing protein n=1 Tax=Chaetomium fimeti TaxID=1854472 RepID=A0AAE0HDZ9_9PEZI|nr:HotDog domain-containing protein [Chaetomium fimeti]
MVPKSRALLRGGGAQDGEDPERPFLLFNALLDLGEDLCGHKGTLHGGALMVLLDETMGAAANNQSDYAFTATMHTSFLKPVMLPGPVIVRSRVIRRERRKIYVRGTVEDGEGTIMAESEAMLVDKAQDKATRL